MPTFGTRPPRLGVRSLGCLAGVGLGLLALPTAGPAEQAVPEGAGDGAAQLEFLAGKALFDKLWVSSPSSTLVSDGLGPLYNARSCAACHPGGGGAGLPGAGEPSVGLVVQISVSGPQGPEPDPVYGRQIQTRGIAGHAAEAAVRLDWTEHEVALSGGETARLRQPEPSLTDVAYGAPAPGLMLSPRLAPRLRGLGLIDRLPDAAILAAEDPEDRDGDGISGRANRDGAGRPGRFGWKASQPDLRHQAAAAFADDIGLGSPLRPGGWGDCTAAQAACRAAPDGAGPDGAEVTDQMLDLVSLYTRNLAAPVPAGSPDPRGAELFETVGCALCHRPRLGDAPDAPAAYSDFLLHDMGPGLADHRPQGDATGQEWRTAPLWGMSARGPDGHPAPLLHDGRARSPLEAILWHDGEARPMRDRVVEMPPKDRAALIRYLESL
ncbi:di-heme oxidoredictase family protein [Frigidibacter sp. ROC022]|uniref:di-heme oxidoredictase family protein n=1 Tax=Frigidibacter sp. ROC022 TaxID=2971796 RepID=UPI00215B0467|nr:di-heme oxidoredictase family protein [Frigidibacter sp. ROC022]MCR8724165.1 c-type cytochrome [Frigidibacter sp. ROC022]